MSGSQSDGGFVPVSVTKQRADRAAAAYGTAPVPERLRACDPAPISPLPFYATEAKDNRIGRRCKKNQRAKRTRSTYQASGTNRKMLPLRQRCAAQTRTRNETSRASIPASRGLRWHASVAAGKDLQLILGEDHAR
jgi:hypothetical protein